MTSVPVPQVRARLRQSGRGERLRQEAAMAMVLGVLAVLMVACLPFALLAVAMAMVEARVGSDEGEE